MALAAQPDARAATKPPKLASVVARRIEDGVLLDHLPVGTVVGSESELLERFGVSRAVLREAVRIVEHNGTARMRRGPGGGLVVSEPDRTAVATAISVWFSYVGVTVDELLEARAPLITESCRLAAGRVDDAMAAALRERFDDLAARPVLDAQDFADLGALLCELSGNPVLALFGQAVGEVVLSRVRGTRAKLDPPISHDDSAAHLHAYRRLGDTILAGDAAGAVRRVELIETVVRARLHDRPVRPRRRPVALDGVGSGKLAERVAAAVRDDIERAGWPVGHVLGSEAELVARYDVSRAILREAVRILEHHGAVRTKRGPGGGLVVAEPDAAAIVRAAYMSLEREGVTVAQLLAARSALELATVALAAERITAEGAAELQEAVRSESERGTVSRFHEVHRDIARMSGNRALALFIDVTSELTTGRVPPAQQRREALAAISEEVNRAHAAVVAAIVAGDAGAARRRMARHLEASLTVLE